MDISLFLFSSCSYTTVFDFIWFGFKAFQPSPVYTHMLDTYDLSKRNQLNISH